MLFGTPHDPVQRPDPASADFIDVQSMAAHLAGAIRLQTVSSEHPTHANLTIFSEFRDYLRQTYPNLHQTLKCERVGPSLLYTWPGTDAALDAVLLISHMDVVPAGEPLGKSLGEVPGWKHPPFSGEIADSAVWGRGAIDAKGTLIAVCEAVETLAISGWKPRRTIYIAFGHDEEIGGLEGAGRISQLLAERNVRLASIHDEGGAISQGIVPGIDKPVALIGIAEKGYVSVELTVNGAGGHASMPPASTAIGTLCRAIARLEAHPFPLRLNPVTRQMLEHLAPHMPGLARFAISQLWLLGPLVQRILAGNPANLAMMRSTCAVTVLHAGVKDNVLPSDALAVVNCRPAPGETSESVISRIREVINDPSVKVTVAGRLRTEPSPIAQIDSAGYRAVEESIAQIAPGAVIAPFLVLGGTDSRHYARLSPQIFRFTPVLMTPEDLATIHGNNERLTFENCRRMVGFYLALLRRV
jgi:carboxypeptidase PM20D1